MTIQIGRFEFPSKAGAQAAIRRVLSKYGQMEWIRGEDEAFVLAILGTHPHQQVVTDPGVASLHVQHIGERYYSRRFMVIRTDRSRRDFTWRHAITKRDQRANVLHAVRQGIKDQTEAFRDGCFATSESAISSLIGDPVIRCDAHVDHYDPEFLALAQSWIEANRLTWEDVDLVESLEYGVPPQPWTDPFLEDNWREYHREFANLRMLSRCGNLSLARRRDDAA